MHLVILLFALFASLFTLQKETLSYCEPFFLVGSRMLLAGIMLLAYMLIKHRKSIRISKEHIAPIMMLSLSNIYLTNIFEIWAINNMVSSKACLIYSLSPFVAALMSFIVLKERLNSKKMLGMVVGFLGLVPIIFMQTKEELLSSGSFLMFSNAELAIVGAVFTSVYGWIMLKKLVDNYDYSPLFANGISMTVGGILALLHSSVTELWMPLPVTDIKPYLINTLVMTLISNIVCYNLYGFLLKRFTATFMSFAGLVTPLFASLFGYIFLNELISWHFFVAIFLFTIGLVIFYKEEIVGSNGFKIRNSSLDPA